jgi:hypothetical protein
MSVGFLMVVPVVVTVALHVFWIIAATQYQGKRARWIRGFWIAYLIGPLLAAGAFARSVFLKPLTYAPEAFGEDARIGGFILVWVVWESVIATAGVMILAAQANWGPQKPPER